MKSEKSIKNTHTKPALERTSLERKTDLTTGSWVERNQRE